MPPPACLLRKLSEHHGQSCGLQGGSPGHPGAGEQLLPRTTGSAGSLDLLHSARRSATGASPLNPVCLIHPGDFEETPHSPPISKKNDCSDALWSGVGTETHRGIWGIQHLRWKVKKINRLSQCCDVTELQLQDEEHHPGCGFIALVKVKSQRGIPGRKVGWPLRKTSASPCGPCDGILNLASFSLALDLRCVVQAFSSCSE